MCNRCFIIFTWIVLCLAQPTNAQENLPYFFRHINQSDGLLHNQVVAFAQDSKGYMWIATMNGLQRYDGTRFQYYPDILSSPYHGLTSGADIHFDKKNNSLWILKNTDVEKLDRSKLQFSLFDSGKNIKSDPYQTTIFWDINDQTWLFEVNDQVKRLSHNKDIFIISITPDQSRQQNFIATDSAGNYWAPMGTQLCMFEKSSGIIFGNTLNPAQHPLFQKNGFNKNILRHVMIDSRQNIWVTTWDDEFYQYEQATQKLHRYSLAAIKNKQGSWNPADAGLLINCMLEDDHQTIWIGTENAGLLRYNKSKDVFDYCVATEKKKEGIDYNYKIFNLFQDREENIWIGTDKGISIFNPYQQTFSVIKHEENNPASISKNEILSFIQTPRGDLFLGTWGAGIAVYDDSFRYHHSLIFNGPKEKNFVWSMLQADSNSIWMGCQHGYLLIYDQKTGKETTLHPPEMMGRTIRSMTKDPYGNIWLGLQNGMIIKWDKKTGAFLSPGKEWNKVLKKQAPVTDIYIDNNRSCWVTSMDGFHEFDLQKRIYVQTWLPGKNNPAAISGSVCNGIEAYNDSIMLISTLYGGLNFFNKRTKSFTHLDASDGFPSNSIYAIKKDIAGNIWITNDYGIYQYKPAEKKVIPFGIEPGIINSSFSANRFYPLQNGQWLSFTTSEAISFNPTNIAGVNKTLPKTEITGFKLFDRPIPIDSLLDQHKTLELSYKENFFSIEFSALNYSNLAQTHYYYQLTGVDKGWVDAANKRYAQYTNIAPGEYLFQVKAEQGDRAGNITSFAIRINPPFWETTWFVLICLLLTGLFLYWIIRSRFQFIRKEEKIKTAFQRQMADMEMKALRSQMNPHFIFNCINSIDALIQSNDKYHATVYLNTFAKLLRNILDSTKHNTVNLSKDMDTLKLYIELEKLRHENKFKAEIRIAEDLLQEDYKVPPLIIQPFVENAILHGIRHRADDLGKLMISVSLENNHIKYIIEDNGVGRPKNGETNAGEKTSYGIDMSSNRVKLYNNEKEPSVEITDLFIDGKPAGTRVTIFLKIV